MEDCDGVGGEGMYACMVRKLQMEESQEGRKGMWKATIGTKLGLQVILDQLTFLEH